MFMFKNTKPDRTSGIKYMVMTDMGEGKSEYGKFVFVFFELVF